MKRATTTLLLLAAILASGARLAQGAAAELVTNGSFEAPVTAAWGAAPTNWTIGPPEPSAVNYPWLQPIWSLVGANPDGSQIAALNGNCRQTVGNLQANKYYTLNFWVYFRSNQQFYGDLTTTPWSGGLLRFVNDGGTLQNIPSPLPLNQWINLKATVNTIAPAYAGQVGQPLYVHFWSTGSANEILLDKVSLIEDDTPPAPTTYYVSQSIGNDGNNGLSPATAWKTFGNVNWRTLVPGDQVLLKRGDTWTATNLNLNGKGTVANPILLGAYGTGPNPVITAADLTTATCVTLQNPSYVNVDSIDCRDGKVGLYLRYTGGNTDGTGAMFNNQSVHVTGCNFRNFDQPWSDGSGQIAVLPPYELSWGCGIWIGGSIPAPPGGPWPSESTLVLNDLQVRHCSFRECSTGVGSNWYFPPTVYRGRLTNVVLEDSWVTGCENGSLALFYTTGGHAYRWDTWLGGTGFYASGTTGGFLQNCSTFTIDNCEFAGNLRNSTGNDGTGFDFEGDCQSITFTNNVLRQNDGAGLLLLPTSGANGNLQMQGNTIWNNLRNPNGTGQNQELIAANGSGTGNFGNNGVYLGTNGVGSLAVYNNTTRWNTNFAANTSGNRTATAWSAVSGRPTTWGFTSSVEGWGAQNQWTGFAASGGSLVGTSSGTDPYAEGPATWVNTRANRTLRVRMSQTAGSFAQVFFQTETDATWTAGKSLTFAITPDGTQRDYTIDMGACAAYKGVVTKWRLDPTDAAGSAMAIDSFEARPEPIVSAVGGVSTASVDVLFNMPMLPEGGVLTPANFSVSGPGKGTVNTTPDHVTPVTTANGTAYRLGWNSGSTLNQPITVTVVNAQSARGTVVLNGGTGIAVPVTLSELTAE